MDAVSHKLVLKLKYSKRKVVEKEDDIYIHTCLCTPSWLAVSSPIRLYIFSKTGLFVNPVEATLSSIRPSVKLGYTRRARPACCSSYSYMHVYIYIAI
jgi:hypothetical protein